MKRNPVGVIAAALALLWGGSAVPGKAVASDVWDEPTPSPVPVVLAPTDSARVEHFTIYFDAPAASMPPSRTAPSLAATTVEVADFTAMTRAPRITVSEPSVVLLFLSALAVVGASLLRVRRGESRPNKKQGDSAEGVDTAT